MKRPSLLGFLLFGMLALAGISNLQAQDEAIEERKKVMKNNSAAAKAIKAAVGKKDYGTIASRARQIADALDMRKLAEHFPQNSTSSESRARPDIWAKWDDFMGKAYDSQQKALALAKAAEARDGGKVSAAYKDFGKTCGSCHKPFRLPKKK